RIPPRAAAIQLRLVPTPHRPIPLPAAVIAAEVVAAVAAVAIAVEVAPAVVAVVVVEATAAVEAAAVHIVVVVVAEVHTAVEAPALTVGTNLVLKFKGPPANPHGPFALRDPLRLKFSLPFCSHNSSRPPVLDEVKDFVSGICCFDMGKVRSQCSVTMKCYCLE